MTAILTIVLLACIAANEPFVAPVYDDVDLIEVNHVLDERGQPQFTQYLFRNWSSFDGKFHLVDWRMCKDDVRPQYSKRRDRYVLAWFDGPTWRTVDAKWTVESYSFGDPEIEERESLPMEFRVKLSSPTRRTSLKNPINRRGL